MVNSTHIPVELRQRRQWVAATITPDPQRPGKTTKRPINPATGGLASTTDPATWGAFEDAIRRAEELSRQGAGGAIGFVFTADDPYVGVDFDGCFDERGNLDAQVAAWVECLGSYTEVSASGKGLHVIVRGELPPGGRRKGQVEMYDRSRFFVLTGERRLDYPAEVRERPIELAWLHRAVFDSDGGRGEAADGEFFSKRRDDLSAASPLRDGMPDEEVLRLALDARNGAEFEALWLGRATKHASASEADFALACRLAFWTGGNLAQMDRIFRRSGLMRPKWDEKHYGNGQTYGAVTLANALSQTKEFYRASDVGAGLPRPGNIAPSSPGRGDPAPTDVLPLPEGVVVDPALGRGAAPWLDAFVAYARECLPWAYGEYAVAAGLHVLSTVAARRVLVEAGGQQFTNLYVVLVGPSSYAGKSRTARVGLDLLETAGLGFLRAPDQTTPQAFVKRCSARLAADWKKRGNADKWALEKLKAAFAGQSGWFYDEFGSFIVQILNDNGPYQGFRRMLKEFDGCPLRYESETISRATETVELPYLTVLAAMTPGQFGKARRKFGELAEDGFWARFAFVAPPPDWTKPAVRAPKDLPPFPARLTRELVEWHKRLGIPQVEELEPLTELEASATGEGGLPKAKGAKGASEPGELLIYRRPPQPLGLADEVYEAYNRYREALEELAHGGAEEIAGNYSRHAERTLRIAALLASLQGNRLELRHWAYAQGIAERWREGLHWALDAASVSAVAPDVEAENKITGLLERKGAMTARDLHRNVPALGANTLKMTIDALVKVGEVRVIATNRNGNPVYASGGSED